MVASPTPQHHTHTSTLTSPTHPAPHMTRIAQPHTHNDWHDQHHNTHDIYAHITHTTPHITCTTQPHTPTNTFSRTTHTTPPMACITSPHTPSKHSWHIYPHQTSQVIASHTPHHPWLTPPHHIHPVTDISSTNNIDAHRYQRPHHMNTYHKYHTHTHSLMCTSHTMHFLSRREDIYIYNM